MGYSIHFDNMWLVQFLKHELFRKYILSRTAAHALPRHFLCVASCGWMAALRVCDQYPRGLQNTLRRCRKVHPAFLSQTCMSTWHFPSCMGAQRLMEIWDFLFFVNSGRDTSMSQINNSLDYVVLWRQLQQLSVATFFRKVCSYLRYI